MTLGQKVLARLDKERKAGIETTGWRIEVNDGQQRARVQINDWDRYGGLVDWVEVTRRPEGYGHSDPAQAPDQEQKADWCRQSHQLAQVTGYLTESLRFLELDERQGESILRSANPQADESHIDYYEVRLRHGRSAHFRRQRYDRKAHRRMAIPALLTYPVVGRLVDDLAGSLVDGQP